MKIQNVKGGYDYLPESQQLRNFINDTLKEIFESYGFKPIETPILCYYDILSDKYEDGADILKEIYQLKDQGERKLGLRYDLTVPFAKFIALNKNNITLPFKRFEIAKCFRDGPIKQGRDREFTQCDVDVVGLGGMLIEAELLSIFKEAFSRLKIDIVIKYNNRKYMNGLLESVSIPPELIPKVTINIDKKEKLSPQEYMSNFYNLGLTEEQTQLLDKYFSYNLNEAQKEFKNTNINNLKIGIQELKELSIYIEKLGLKDYTLFTPTLARGQNYYTGNVFEVYDKKGRITSSIGGGGRYDNMITDFICDGNNYPAVGISFGLSAIYEILKNEDVFKNSFTDILIIPLSEELEALNLANNLRKMGIKVDIDLRNCKLKKSLEYADKKNIKYIIIVGEDEIKKQEIKLKNMQTKEEILLKFNELSKTKNYFK